MIIAGSALPLFNNHVWRIMRKQWTVYFLMSLGNWKSWLSGIIVVSDGNRDVCKIWKQVVRHGRSWSEGDERRIVYSGGSLWEVKKHCSILVGFIRTEL